MIERNELITVCRQIGGMMEAGVDILRITRVLRAQTENPRLLSLYDALDRDMTMGRSLAEAMSRAPDVFSPFVVQMVQQGEARNDLAGAFLKVADYLKQEQELDDEQLHSSSTRSASNRQVARVQVSQNATTLSNPPAPDLLPTRATPNSPLTVIALDGLMDRLQTFMLRALTIMAGLMLSLACVWWLLELGYVEKRWSLPLAFSVTAVFLGGAGSWIQRRIRAERRREARCSFCGRQGVDLQRAPRFAGAAICARCAAIVAKKSDDEPETTHSSAEISSDAEHSSTHSSTRSSTHERSAFTNRQASPPSSDRAHDRVQQSSAINGDLSSSDFVSPNFASSDDETNSETQNFGVEPSEGAMNGSTSDKISADDETSDGTNFAASHDGTMSNRAASSEVADSNAAASKFRSSKPTSKPMKSRPSRAATVTTDEEDYE